MRRIDDFVISFVEEHGVTVLPEQSKKIKAFYDWMGSATGALVVVFLLFTFLARIATVNGPSMMPTLNNGDLVVVSDVSNKAEFGDVVVVTLPNKKPIIKRVIAVGGQTVDINFDVGIVMVDGQILTEEYTSGPTFLQGDVSFPLTVPEGFVFVLGDNRGNSKDSRMSETGLIDRRYILGISKLKIFPPGIID